MERNRKYTCFSPEKQEHHAALFVSFFFRIFDLLTTLECTSLQYIVCLVSGFFIGSFPTAYLLVKWKSRIDIRSAGSGNVGAMNTYDVTGSRLLGIAVMIGDLLKGVLATSCGWLLSGRLFWGAALAGTAAVVGHNYSPWLRFKGGRGLATTVGVMLVCGWPAIVAWSLLWVIVYGARKNIHLANIAATVLGLLVFVIVPQSWVRSTAFIYQDFSSWYAFLTLVCLLILVKHLGYVRQLKDLIMNQTMADGNANRG